MLSVSVVVMIQMRVEKDLRMRHAQIDVVNVDEEQSS